MDIQSMSIEELGALLRELVSGEVSEEVAERVRDILRELSTRERPDPDPFFDPSTGTKLTPSFHGRECLGNGEWPGYECCCDECDFFIGCFPDWKPGAIWDETEQRYI